MNTNTLLVYPEGASSPLYFENFDNYYIEDLFDDEGAFGEADCAGL